MVNFTAQSGAADRCQIEHNTIKCSYGNPLDGTSTRTTDAIRIFGDADGYEINHNHIFFNDPVNLAAQPNATITNIGIGVDNNTGMNNTIADNDLHGTYFTTQNDLQRSWLRCGTHLINAPNFRLCRNFSENGTHHFHFLNDSDNFEFGRNVSNGNGRLGLVIDQGPIPNNHDHRRNLWLGTYVSFGAEHDNPQSNLRWLADGSVAGQVPATQTPVGWIFPQPDNNQANFCDNITAVTDAGTAIKDITTRFLNGSYSFAGDAAAWDFERTLLEHLIRFPSAQAGSTAIQQYYSGKINTAQWQLANARHALHNACAPGATEETNLRLLYEDTKVIADSVRLLEAVAAIDTTVYDSLLHVHIDQLLNQAQAQITTALQDITATRIAALTTLLSNINSISSNSAIESNYKTILQLMTITAMDEEWTDGEQQSVRDIANLCYEEYGLSVLTARQLLPVEEQHHYPSVEVDDPKCGAQNRQNITRNNLSDFTLRAIPNPANQVVNLSFDSDFSGTIQFCSASGQIIQDKKYPKTRWVTTDVSSWPNGVYWLRCVPENGTVQHKEIIIQH